MDLGKQKELILAKKPQKNKYLHTENHALAEHLTLVLKDPKHFGFYLKQATLHNHSFLRKLAAEVTDNKNVKTPGKLFAYLIKKYNSEQKNDTTNN